jgi:FlaA1/EpsC-like NDP-sugar epimerase
MRNRYILLSDLPLIAIAAFGAFALRFDWTFLHNRPEFWGYLGMALVLKPLVYFPFGLYSRYWRYATAQDLLAVALAASAASVVMAVAVGIGRATGLLPSFARPVLLIDWLLTIALAGGLRMSIRIIGESSLANRASANALGAGRVLVVGAGEAGTLVVRELRRNPQLGLVPVAFVDDAEVKWKKWIHGLPVRGALSSIESVVARDRIDQVVIAMPTASGGVVRAAADACRQAGIVPRIVPGVFELLDGQVTVNRLRKVEIADLLRRPQVTGRADRLSYLRGRTVLITGAGGSIGSELVRQVAYCGPARLILLGHGENSIYSVHLRVRELYPDVEVHAVVADVRDARRLESVFLAWKPDVVFHAAAHKHVPLMEENPEEAITNNVGGTRNVVDTATRTGVARLVSISTDKAVEPSSVMGASKRVAELLVLEAARRTRRHFAVVRFGNVLGSRGSVVPLMQAQIERGGPVTITHPDMKRYFMTIPEAAQLVLQAGDIGGGGDLFVLNMGQPLKILDLARDLIRLSGLDPGAVAIETTGPRPGEKLEERLWERDDEVDSTVNPDVFRVCSSAVDLDVIRRVADELVLAAENGSVNRLHSLLARVVPSFGKRFPVSPLPSGLENRVH